ncbi:MAG: flagellar assembly protein FliW [Bdellovibrionales bacterium]|nr:flagellar assembly protein FliW [Bdellovibrionales bacterium]
MANPDDTPVEEMMTVKSSRFGEFEVARSTIITLPTGLIGFSQGQQFIMLEHKPPFSWLQSVDNENLAFVVVDGYEFGDQYQVEAPFGDATIDLQEGDEFAILVIVTVRSDPKDTTANLKAPIFVNLKNRKGIQVIFDNPNYSTRFPLWTEEAQAGEETPSGDAPKGEGSE